MSSRHEEPPIKVFILTSRTPGNIFLVNRILSEHDVVGMAIEAPPPALTSQEKRARRLRMLRRHGVVRTLNKLLYNWYRSRLLRDAEKSSTSLFPGGASADYVREVPTEVVENINDPAVVRLIRQVGADVIAVCGTSVVKPEVFTLARLGAINIHTGITPEYRSADPIFWALYNGEPDKVGVTIHFVDAGIDTGPIIHQDTVPLFADDTLATIFARCIRRGAELYLQALKEIETRTVRTVSRPGVQGRAYYSINLGIVQYFIFRMRFRRLKRSLPPSTLAAAGPSRACK